ncbi:putative aliphatic sulfonates transport permease protein SsuC [Arthrobacter sp. Hiyo6]|nr:putative aliphatic sulfonates transport permease protein SsuC [Arthrobacter sp. Hiyo6]
MFDPIVAGAFAIPRVVFFPILLQIFGVGVGAAAMAALAAVFPIMVSTTAGVRATGALLPKLARSLSLSALQTVTKIYIPAMAPSLMVGIRIGFSIAFINVIIAEFFAARAGLGLLALRAYGMLDLPTMYGIIVLLAAIALGGNLALWL